MSLTLEIVSHQARMLGKGKIKAFGHAGGTIGRSLDADWALPDGQCYLSNRHASIDFRSGSYYIVDTSKNGVFVNDAEDPVGRGKPQRLFPGDRIRIGDYEMLVSIEGADDETLDSDHVDPVDARERVAAPSATSIDLIDADALTAAETDVILELEKSQPLELIPDLPPPKPNVPRTAPRSRKAQPATRGKTATQQQPRRTAQPARQGAASANAGPTNGTRAALDAFFRGAGLNTPDLSDGEAEQLMEQLGEVTREFIRGIIECLRFRAIQKAQLKQGDTIIQPAENNRLKFSPNFEEGFSRLFLDKSDAYLSPTDSVRSAFADIKGHQAGILSGMRAALNEYLDRLEPRELEQRATSGRKASLLQAANKLRYWDLYKDVYAVLASRPESGLPQPFLDALAAAYEKGTMSRKKDSGDLQETG
jgi:type VI secretion system protein